MFIRRYLILLYDEKRWKLMEIRKSLKILLITGWIIRLLVMESGGEHR